MTPPIATAPLSFAPLFVVRNEEGFESLDRIATLQDLATLPQAELKYFDVRGPGGDAAFAPAIPGGPLGPFAGDTLTFPETTGRLSYWLEDSAPYNTNIFTVKQSAVRAQGTLPQILTGGRLQLPNYTFTPNDVNRWVNLSGFTTSSYNGLCQILGYVGNTATINKTTPIIETGGAWSFPYIEIETQVSPSLEPRFFPTKENNLRWELRRGAALVASASFGGVTMRASTQTLCRSLRYTAVSSSNQAALDFMSFVRNGVANLQRAATLNDTDFTVLITSTYGP